MTYRTKLFAMLLALVAATGGLLTWANYVKGNGLLQQEVHRKARSIASTTATLLDPDVIKTIRGRSHETRAEYTQLRALLRAVRDAANRREDVWIERFFARLPRPVGNSRFALAERFGGKRGQRFHRAVSKRTLALQRVLRASPLAADRQVFARLPGLFWGRE